MSDTPVRFSEEDLNRFSRSSHDANPIHMDSSYARKTSGGQRIVFGVLAVLRCLEHLRDGDTLRLRRVEATFSHPIFLDVDYQIRGHREADGSLVAELRDGDLVLLKLRTSVDTTAHPERAMHRHTIPSPREVPETTHTRTISRDYDEEEFCAGTQHTGVYTVGRDGIEASANEHVAPLQTDILQLSSYLVGMELPGRRALFFKLELEFEANTDHRRRQLRYLLRTRHYEPAYGLLEMGLEVRDATHLVACGVLTAFVRKKLGPLPLASVRAHLKAPAGCLAGKVALVTGGSRGLGAAIVQALALQGCDVIVNFLSARKDAETLDHGLTGVSGRIVLVQGDARSPKWCKETKDAIVTRYGGLDFLICNACAPPNAVGNSPSGSERMQAYIEQNLALVTTPLDTFLDLLEANSGVLAAVSSSIVIADTDPWPHYKRMKLAVEHAVQAASARHPGVAFLLARPPSLLTEMSNTPARSVEALSPDIVASAIVDALSGNERDGRVRILSDFCNHHSGPSHARKGAASGERIIVAGTFTVSPLLPAIDVWAKALGYGVDVEQGPYNQVYQALLDPSSEFSLNQNGLNVILLRFGDWLRDAAEREHDERCGLLHRSFDELIEALRIYSQRRHCPSMVLLCPESPDLDGHAAIRQTLDTLAERLFESLSGIAGIDAINVRDYHARYRVAEPFHDALGDEIGHMPFPPWYFALLGTLIVRRFHHLVTPPRKAIVIDCDNTLWRGICGELGPEEVKIDDAALVLQRFLAQQKKAGMLLCLCSKNNATDVDAVFDYHEHMPLSRKDIVASRINWDAKPTNIESLAEELGLGLDSFVFLDDSALECEQVTALCPQVLSVQVPQERHALERILAHLWPLDHLQVTQEDEQRTELYRADAERRRLEATCSDLGAFLDGLNLAVEIEEPPREAFARIAQLTQRTNQFNLTGVRRTAKDIEALVEGAALSARLVRVRDRFGDYGLVGFMAFAESTNDLCVESFMLSCRVLGRGVEHRMMAALGRLARDKGLTGVTVAFARTARNQPAELFLGELCNTVAGKVRNAGEWCFQATALAALRYEPVETRKALLPQPAQPVVAPCHDDSCRPASDPQALLRVIYELSDLEVLSRRVREAKNVAARKSMHRPSPAPVSTTLRQQLIDDTTVLFAETLGVALDVLDAEAPLETYVVDSIDVVTLTVALKRRYPDLANTILFEQASVVGLVEHLLEAHGDVVRGRLQTETTAAPSSARGITAAEHRALARQGRACDARQTNAEPAHADIAIIGINGRYPQAPTLEDFWENLVAAKSCLRDIPEDRWPVDAFYDAQRQAGKSYCKQGGFLDDIDRFDAGFFHVSPKEAELMDPQQRLFLEIVWGLLENAGYTPHTIARETGVFVGCNANDYGAYANALALDGIAAYRNADYYQIPNRISYFFDLRGPSLCLDTACSSSGTAVYLACQSLRHRHCKTAIVGGVNLFLHPSRHVQYSQMQMLSPSGRCRPFAAEADGTVFGEGVGALLLKPLAAARADGDHIHGVIKACAVNAGGKTNGFTVPNPQRQGELIIEALHEAEIDPRSITYVEAHGTGTPLGDPIEVRGLTTAFECCYTSEQRDTQFCALGSVKGNIGHLEAGAAIAGIIKVLLQMRHATLVPSLHAETTNPAIPFQSSPFYVQKTLGPWPVPVPTHRTPRDAHRRRAAISSFGAGGSNAHIIVEQDLDERERPFHESQAQLVLLSAENRPTLQSYATRLARFLNHASPSAAEDKGRPSLADIAYTLRVGRAEMQERIALIASSIEDLAAKLERWVVGCEQHDDTPDAQANAIYRGNAKQRDDDASALPAGDDRQRYIESLIAERQLDKLAELWVSGVGIAWSELDGGEQAAGARRVPLPSYPFQGERFWLPGYPNLTLGSPHAGDALHPLLDHVASRLSVADGIVFEKTLGRDEPVVRDHVVAGEALVPGVGLLEMACAATHELGVGDTCVLSEVVWSQPLVVNKESRRVLIAINARDDALSYEIRDTTQGDGAVYSSGTIRASHEGIDSALESVSIKAVQQRAERPLDKANIYRQFHAAGIDYGAYFQSLERVVLNDEEALGTIRLPRAAAHELTRYTLHPSVVDAALQTALLLTLGHGNAMLPFSAAAVVISRPVEPTAYAYVQRTGSTHCQVSLLNEDGAVCVHFRDLCLRELKDPLERFFYAPRWTPSPLVRSSHDDAPKHARDVLLIGSEHAVCLGDALAARHDRDQVWRITLGAKTRRLGEHAWEVRADDGQGFFERVASLDNIDRIYFLGGILTGDVDTGDLDALEHSQELGVRSLFRTIKALQARKHTQRSISLFILTNDVFDVVPNTKLRPSSASLLGLGKVAAKECPELGVRCIDVSLEGVSATLSDPEQRQLLDAVLAEPACDGYEVAIRDGCRYLRTLEAVRIPGAPGTPFRQRGTYLILGGAGGLGFALSRHLAKSVNAHLVWLGRSGLDARKRKKIEEIAALGGEALYLQADATDLASMRRAVAQVNEYFGPIKGAVHSAIVLSDKTLEHMNEAQFNAALDPKVKGSAVLYKALEHEPLDFMLLFSSANSFMASMGQSNYVAGCCFKDAIGLCFNARGAGFPTKVLNWGYWGDVGVVAGEDYHKRITARGHRPILTSEGTEAICRVLGSPLSQVAAIKADEGPLVSMGVALGTTVELFPDIIPSLISGLAGESHAPRLDAEHIARFRRAFAELEAIARHGLVAALGRMGLRARSRETYDPDTLRARLGITEDYARLYDALLDLLIAAGFFKRADNRLVAREKLARDERADDYEALEQRARDLTRQFPEIAERVPLLMACLRALPEVLTGKRGHMDVMFPGGSLHLVENIYKGNDITQHFNRRLADLIARYVRQRLAADAGVTIRILELGAGTGASSGVVLDALRNLAAHVRYVYTDISSKFLRHGDAVFGADFPFVEFKRLDMEQAPELQGFDRDSVDVVFGTNCVHATRDITTTLQRIKRLLRTRGVLLLNEFTERLDYNTLTFGLTSGWWLFEDAPFRIPHTPLLDHARWRQVLEGSGIGKVQFLDLVGVDAQVGQCLIVGESDGKAVDSEGCTTAVARAQPEPEPAPTVDAEALKLTHSAGPAAGGLAEHAERYVKDVFSTVLKSSVTSLATDVTFDEFGVDSLIALEINQRFEKDFGKLPATLLFENPTLKALIAYFLEHHREALGARFTVVEPLPKVSHAGAVPSAAVAGRAAVQASSGGECPAHVSRSRDEDVAIIGMAGRYPMADTLVQFWQNLRDGVDCIREIPPERWNWQAHYDPHPDASRTSHSKWGGFINDIDKFDALFFNVSPKEARRMDPQERLFLETVWHAVEDAAYTRKTLATLQQRHGRGIGVFVGCMYQQYPFVAGEPETGAMLSTSSYWSIANRISYVFDFSGPSLAVDSACSSSLTALHLACESIRRGECIMAVVGGVNLNLHPSKYRRLQQWGMLSSTAQSKSIGDGDGLVPGEGVGAVLLKPLSAAMEDRDPIHGTIKTTVLNHGGKTSGFTVPNPNAHADLIATALDKAGVDPRTVGYVEVAANGSALGDPIEIAGLTKAFERWTPDRQFCAIGAVKSNIGHVEAVSGIAQLSKVLLQLKHRTLVPSLHAEPLNPKLTLEETPFYVQTRLAPWPAPETSTENDSTPGPRRGAISSFGAGGSNAHVLVEEYCERVSPRAAGRSETPQLIVLSAKTEQALERYVANLLHFVCGRPEPGASAPPEEALIDRIRDEMVNDAAEILGIDQGHIDADRDLGEYGFDAIHYVVLAARLRERHGIDVAHTFLFRIANFKGIACHLVAKHADTLRGRHAEAFKGEPTQPLEPHSQSATLTDIAYSLQLGRELMRHRLAVVAASKQQLAQRLNAYRLGASDIPGLYCAVVPNHTGNVEVLFEGAEGAQYLDSLIYNRRLEKLGQLWTMGADIDWARLHVHTDATERPRRVSVPTYPFAKHRHWVDEATGTEALEQTSTPHPEQVTQARSERSEAQRTTAGATTAGHEPAPRVQQTPSHVEHLEQDIAQLAGELLEVDKEEIDVTEELRIYGFDSISLTLLAQRVGDTFGIQTAASQFFGVASIRAGARDLWASNQACLTRYYEQREEPRRLTHTSTSNHRVKTRVSATTPQLITARADDETGVAIIGISVKLPRSTNMDQFWTHLVAGRELIGEVPSTRWNWREHHEANGGGDEASVRWGSFIDDVDKFDSLFFGISPREAQLMDPRQRLLMETVWSTIEDAGYAPRQLAGSNTGLFVGVGDNDYRALLRSNNVAPTAHASTGLMVNSVLTGRVSYHFDLRGPSELVDTACSSSTVAIHKAVRALRSEDCELAIAGGVNVLLDPQGFTILDKAGVLSADGKVKLFSEDGSGYVRGEGIASVLLKPLAAARSDRDHIYAVIRGTAVNHGGRSYSLTAPNPRGQAEVILQAHRDAGIDPGTVNYIEAQGTGSLLGDPVEVDALKKAFKTLYQDWGLTGERHACGIGYLKPNVGHLECASGAAALAKILWALKKSELPAVQNVDDAQARKHLGDSPFYIVRNNQPWEQLCNRTGEPAPKCAGLHSFGFGGVNAHVVLEEFVEPPS